MLAAGHFGQIGGAGAVLAAQAQALDHAHNDQQGRGQGADLGVGRDGRDRQGAAAHHGDRQGQGRAPSGAVGIKPHDPGADRPHEEADGEHRGGVQKLGGLIALGKESAGEIQGEGRIDVPVEPFDQIAGRAADDRFEPNRAAKLSGLGALRCGCCHEPLPICREPRPFARMKKGRRVNVAPRLPGRK